MDKLKKCPFCGGEAEFATSHKRWVQCKECLAESVYCDTPEQAIAAWNNRKPVEDVLERLEKKIKPLHNPNWNAAIEESIQIIKGELL